MVLGAWSGLKRIGTATYAIAGSRDSPQQRALAAVLQLGPDAALSHGSAASLWELSGFELEPLHVTRTRATLSSVAASAVAHRPRLFTPHHIVTVDDLPVRNPVATIWSLATGGAHPKKVERVIDTLLVRHLLTTEQLTDSVREFAKRGRQGSTFMRRLAKDRDANFVPPKTRTGPNYQRYALVIGTRTENFAGVG